MVPTGNFLTRPRSTGFMIQMNKFLSRHLQVPVGLLPVGLLTHPQAALLQFKPSIISLNMLLLKKLLDLVVLVAKPALQRELSILTML
jgi:hypothetical protein